MVAVAAVASKWWWRKAWRNLRWSPLTPLCCTLTKARLGECSFWNIWTFHPRWYQDRNVTLFHYYFGPFVLGLRVVETLRVIESLRAITTITLTLILILAFWTYFLSKVRVVSVGVGCPSKRMVGGVVPWTSRVYAALCARHHCHGRFKLLFSSISTMFFNFQKTHRSMLTFYISAYFLHLLWLTGHGNHWQHQQRRGEDGHVWPTVRLPFVESDEEDKIKCTSTCMYVLGM